MELTAGIAERAVLGIVLDHPEEAGRVFARVRPSDFTGPCMLLAEAIHGLRVERKPFDHMLVVTEMIRRNTIVRVGGPAWVADLKNAYSTVALLDGYLDEVVQLVRRRTAWKAVASAAQVLENPGSDPVEVAQEAIARLQGIVDGADADADHPATPTLREFMSIEDEPYDWVIPGLIERGDRMLLTGPEGVGKSELFRMFGVCAAAGVHPFQTTVRHEPQRVLFIDCENGAKQIRRAMGRLLGGLRRERVRPEDTVYVESHPSGFDLTKPEDEARFIRIVAEVQPNLLMTGSLYRLHAADPSDETAARTVTRVIDRCRQAANCAVVVEAHAGLATNGEGTRSVRPIGSSLWLRWPEFGYGLRPVKDFNKETRVCDFVSWRGDRDERAWPRRVMAGGNGSPYPWVVATYDTHNAA